MARLSFFATKTHAMKIVLLLLLSFTLMCCKSEDESNKERLEATIREHFENEAFRANKPVKLFDISSLSYRMIGQPRIDSNRLGFYINREDYYIGLLRATQDVVRSKLNLSKMSRESGMSTVAESYLDEAKDHNNSALMYRDSMLHYAKLDSLVRVKLKTPQSNDKTFFLTKCFIKATFGNENMLDTFRVVVDKDFHIVN